MTFDIKSLMQRVSHKTSNELEIVEISHQVTLQLIIPKKAQ